MRFAYIDSQGKEVSIPSVDALRLRIELGAITHATEFFDSSTGKWAPAADHEIFRTLQRELQGEDELGFVAPPPPAFEPPMDFGTAPAEPAAPGGATVGPESSEEPEAGAGVDAPGAEAEMPTLDPADLAPSEPVVDDVVDIGELVADPAPAEETTDFGDLSFDDVVEGRETEPESDATADTDDLDFSFGDLSVADDDDFGEDEPEDEAAPEPEATFDMGGFETLELAGEDDLTLEAPSDTEASFEAPPVDAPGEEPPAWNVAAEFAADAPGSDPFEQDPVPDELSVFGTDDTALGAEDETASWLADDTPAAAEGSSWETEDPAPSWGGGEADPDPFGEPPADAGPVGDDGLPVRPAADDLPRRDRPRSAPPQRKLTPAKSAGGGAGKLIGMVVAALVVGGGAWFGFQMLSSGSDTTEVAVELPEIPENLEPQLRQLAARASSAMVARMQELPERTAMPEAPPEEWLNGEYLANASEYPRTVEYWNAYAALLREVRARDDAFFAEAFAAEVEAANASATNASLLTERAIAGFAAADRDRDLVYEQLESVIQTSLQLHQFLLDNEENIDYEPATGGLSRDPVLEAVPVTEALQQEMLDQVIAITQALDDLGYLDRVNTEAFLSVFFEKLEVTGIR